MDCPWCGKAQMKRKIVDDPLIEFTCDCGITLTFASWSVWERYLEDTTGFFCKEHESPEKKLISNPSLRGKKRSE